MDCRNPYNLSTARELEAIARSRGVEPCTIAVIGGQVRIGLSNSELERIARASDVLKLARRDIAVAVAGKRDGAVTVSATMYLAHRAGIRVFGTGGIGGVHRGGGQQTWDISADLMEWSEYPSRLCAREPKLY